MSILCPEPEQDMEEVALQEEAQAAFTQALQAGTEFTDQELLNNGAHPLRTSTPNDWGIAVTHVTELSRLQEESPDSPDVTVLPAPEHDTPIGKILSTITTFQRLTEQEICTRLCTELEEQGLYLAPEVEATVVEIDDARGFLLPPEGLTIRNVAEFAFDQTSSQDI